RVFGGRADELDAHQRHGIDAGAERIICNGLEAHFAMAGSRHRYRRLVDQQLLCHRSAPCRIKLRFLMRAPYMGDWRLRNWLSAFTTYEKAPEAPWLGGRDNTRIVSSEKVCTSS